MPQAPPLPRQPRSDSQHQSQRGRGEPDPGARGLLSPGEGRAVEALKREGKWIHLSAHLATSIKLCGGTEPWLLLGPAWPSSDRLQVVSRAVPAITGASKDLPHPWPHQAHPHCTQARCGSRRAPGPHVVSRVTLGGSGRQGLCLTWGSQQRPEAPAFYYKDTPMHQPTLLLRTWRPEPVSRLVNWSQPGEGPRGQLHPQRTCKTLSRAGCPSGTDG